METTFSKCNCGHYFVGPVCENCLYKQKRLTERAFKILLTLLSDRKFMAELEFKSKTPMEAEQELCKKSFGLAKVFAQTEKAFHG
ncbi:MAG: hypothetical protein EBR82_43965 [Caulobacteraceae bacterium]|nr:hypothetical protein [Caulobacteraceae bacterium]